MAFRQILRFFVGARDYVAVTPEEEAAGAAAGAAPRYHRVVVAAGGLGLLAGLVLAIPLIHRMRAELGGDVPAERAGELYLVPPLAAVGGVLFGVVAACACAPRRFLEGPVGRRWMGLIGTRSVAVARLVCAVVAALLAAIPLALVLLPLPPAQAP